MFCDVKKFRKICISTIPLSLNTHSPFLSQTRMLQFGTSHQQGNLTPIQIDIHVLIKSVRNLTSIGYKSQNLLKFFKLARITKTGSNLIFRRFFSLACNPNMFRDNSLCCAVFTQMYLDLVK